MKFTHTKKNDSTLFIDVVMDVRWTLKQRKCLDTKNKTILKG